MTVASAIIAAGCASSRAQRGAHRATTIAPATAPSTTGAPPTTAPGTVPTSVGREHIPAFTHLFVVLMENTSAPGALAVPAIAHLAARYASATAWYAASHPSLPNYLALVAGSTFAVSSDCTGCYQDGPSLASQLTDAGVTWGAYFEGMPAPCFLGPESPDGEYAQKHDPFAYFRDVRSSASQCAHLQPLTALTGLLAGNAPVSAVPRFVWVTPNLCHSGHDCGAAAGGAWLAGFVASVTASPAWRDGGALVVTWDEGTDSRGLDPATGSSTNGGGGNVLTLVIAPSVAAGLKVHTPLDHYSLLRSIEDAFGLPLLREAAAPGTRPMSAFWSG